MEKPAPTDQLPISARLGYGVGIYGPMLGWVAAAQYLLNFYTVLPPYN